MNFTDCVGILINWNVPVKYSFENSSYFRVICFLLRMSYFFILHIFTLKWGLGFKIIFMSWQCTWNSLAHYFCCPAKCHLVHLHGLMITCFIVSIENRWPSYWENDFLWVWESCNICSACGATLWIVCAARTEGRNSKKRSHEILTVLYTGVQKS